MVKKGSEVTQLSSPSLETNGRARGIHEVESPYSVEVTVKGVAGLLFHRYDPKQVRAQEEAKKGSREKKTDNLESMVYRDEEGHLCIPNDVIKATICTAAKSVQDPRSKRKSMQDLARASILVSPPLASLGVRDWDAVDERGVRVQMARITRCRPYMKAGWQVTFTIDVLEPSYISEQVLRDLVDRAGRFCGFLDFRPDYGRFHVVSWKRNDFLSSDAG